MDDVRILIVEPDSRVAELAVIKLSNAGYLVATANDGQEAYEKVINNPPDILIINPNLMKKDGYELCGEIRWNEKTKNLPVIILADQNFNEEQFNLLGLSMSEILTKPFSPKALLNSVNSMVLQAKLVKKINPLTELPGKQVLEDEVNQRINNNQELQLIFCDLKDFRMFNKFYSFEQGNEVIKFLAKILEEEIQKFGIAEPKLFHFGGDDFCILLKSGYAEDLGKTIINRFELEIPQFYYENDRGRGGLMVTNRRGLIEQWPIMTIALAQVGNSNRKISSWLEAEAIGAEMLKYAKSMPGSQFVKDRRSS